MSRSQDQTHFVDEPDARSAQERSELWRKLEKVRMAMLTTHDREGEMTSRPLTTQQVQEEGVAWFFIPLDGGVAEELGRDPRVLLTYADVSDNFFVALRGKAQILKDRAKVKELWSPLVAAWFPRGQDDPSLALLRVDVEKGEYWDPGSSKLVQFFAMAKSALTRTPPKNMGEHHEFRN
jgi:general stress protein 26